MFIEATSHGGIKAYKKVAIEWRELPNDMPVFKEALKDISIEVAEQD